MKPINDQEENELVILHLRQLCEAKQRTHIHIGEGPSVRRFRLDLFFFFFSYTPSKYPFLLDQRDPPLLAPYLILRCGFVSYIPSPSKGEDFSLGSFLALRTGEGVPVVAQRLMNPTSIQEDAGSIPGLDQWGKDPVLPWVVVKVAYVAQILVVVAVAYTGSCSSDSTPGLGTSIWHRCGSKKTGKRKKGRKEGRKEERKKERKNERTNQGIYICT